MKAPEITNFPNLAVYLDWNYCVWLIHVLEVLFLVLTGCCCLLNSMCTMKCIICRRMILKIMCTKSCFCLSPNCAGKIGQKKIVCLLLARVIFRAVKAGILKQLMTCVLLFPHQKVIISQVCNKVKFCLYWAGFSLWTWNACTEVFFYPKKLRLELLS